jgi:hypothetical protein
MPTTANFLSLNFTSYFPASHLLEISHRTTSRYSSKLLLKQSYLLLTWFFYLSTIRKTTKIKIASFPSTQTVFTATKAPMAHKKNSKEQYKLQYFNFHIKYQLIITNTSFDEALLLILYFKHSLVFVETNLFFLKNFHFLLNIKTRSYFNWWQFYNKKHVS